MKTTNIIILALATFLVAPISACAQKQRVNKKTVVAEKDTLAILTEKATEGDASAQNTLGLWYYSGKNVEQNYKTALQWWAKSANQGNPYAIGNMAMCYQLGRGVQPDSTLAVALYKKAVEKGNKDIVAQHEKLAEKKENLFSNALMYELYANGVGVRPDLAKAATYQEVLAEAGDAMRQYRLALYYMNIDRADRAAKWFKAAAEQDVPGALYYYGYLLHKGMGIGQDKGKGIEMMQKAEEKGFLAADYQLGMAYHDGDGVAQDYQKAVEYLKKAAPVNGKAQWQLGLCYLNGEGVACDYDFATQWFAESFRSHEKEFNALLEESGKEAFREYLMGLFHYHVDKDFEVAIACFKKVEKAKRVEGKTMQAMCLANKDYAKGNVKKAAKMLEKASAESPVAKFYLADFYANGIGVQKDEAKASELLTKAADEGVGEAMCALGDKYMAGDGVPQDFVKAAQYYLQAESQLRLTVASAKNLAKCYEKRISGLPDMDNVEKRIEQLNAHQQNDRLMYLLKTFKK